ncbi:MAG TPA: DoxX family protein [Candidatus Nanoarchaeia archaeon]|nr:DoxX family protein [Candidatus Nanoarchaeia archaeon]
MMDRKFANFLLRVVLGVVFTYAGVMKVLAFFNVVTYTFPPINKILTFLPLSTSGLLLGLVEVIIGVLLIIGFWTRTAAWAATILLVIFVLAGAYLGIFMQAALFKDLVMAAAALLLAAEGCRKWGWDCRSLEASA